MQSFQILPKYMFKLLKIQHEKQFQIPTDGLILKGWYNAVTIAIYGALTNVTVEPEALPPPPPPQPRKQCNVSLCFTISH